MNRNRLILIAMLTSLAVNLLIVGFVVGKKRGFGGERPPMAWAVEHLSPETQRRVRGQMRAQLSEVRPLRKDMREAHAAVRRAVAAEDYDPQVLALALEKSREVTERYQALIHKNLVEVSAELPKEQRIALARAALQRGQNTKMPSRPPENVR